MGRERGMSRMVVWVVDVVKKEGSGGGGGRNVSRRSLRSGRGKWWGWG